MKHSKIIVTLTMLLTMLIISGGVTAGSSDTATDAPLTVHNSDESAILVSPGMDNPRVHNVVEQFNNLAIHGDALGARKGVAGEACSCVHYQSIARGQDIGGVPHMFLTRSGNDGPACTDLPCFPDFWNTCTECWPSRCSAECSSYIGDRKPGELVVVELSSRDLNGERLRSNLLLTGGQIRNTVAYGGDAAVGFCPDPEPVGGCHPKKPYLFDGHFDGHKYWPMYMHPGGMQLVGDVLLVALEASCDGSFTAWDPDGSDINCTNEGLKKGAVALIDVRSPAEPKLLHVEELWQGEPWKGVYLVAATYVAEHEHPDLTQGGRYLFVWTDDDKTYYFGWSDTDDLRTTTNIALCRIWKKEYLGQDVSKWNMSWQTLNFVRNADDGALYLIGMGSTSGYANKGADWARLFKVDLSKLNAID